MSHTISNSASSTSFVQNESLYDAAKKGDLEALKTLVETCFSDIRTTMNSMADLLGRTTNVSGPPHWEKIEIKHDEYLQCQAMLEKISELFPDQKKLITKELSKIQTDEYPGVLETFEPADSFSD